MEMNLVQFYLAQHIQTITISTVIKILRKLKCFTLFFAVIKIQCVMP